MMARLTYPTKIAQRLFAKDTVVREATITEVIALWPGITFNPESNQVAVWFPGMEHPTIVHKSQVIK